MIIVCSFQFHYTREYFKSNQQVYSVSTRLLLMTAIKFKLRAIVLKETGDVGLVRLTYITINIYVRLRL